MHGATVNRYGEIQYTPTCAFCGVRDGGKYNRVDGKLYASCDDCFVPLPDAGKGDVSPFLRKGRRLDEGARFEQVADLVRETPGLTRRELMERIGIYRDIVAMGRFNEALKLAVKKRLVKCIKRHGGFGLYFPGAGL